MIATNSGNEKAALLAATLDEAIGTYLENGRNPSRKVNEIDNRGSSFYLAMYWAQALAAQNQDAEMKAKFTALAEKLADSEAVITEELLSAQGEPLQLGGYFHPDVTTTDKAMRPSATLNEIIDGM
jgi:isocitrate dehydrogenase